MQLETFSYTLDTGWSVDYFPALNSSRTLILAFGTPALIHYPQPLQYLAQIYPNSIMAGCSSAGEILGGEIMDNSLVVALIKFEHTNIFSDFAVVSSPDDSYSVGQTFAQKLLAAYPDLRAVLVFSDGILVNNTKLVVGLNSILPPTTVVIGGLASDGERLQYTWVIDKGMPKTSGVVVVGLYGANIVINSSLGGGWGIFGPERIATCAVGNTLYELDDEPALPLYRQYLGEYATNLPNTGLAFPLALRANLKDEKRLVRSLLSIDETSQSLTFAGEIPQGFLAQLMTTNPERLVEGAFSAARKLKDQLSTTEASICLTISCLARRLLLNENAEEETNAILETLPAQTKQIGFYSYGEISPYDQGGLADLHNQTMVLATISEVLAPSLVISSISTTKSDRRLKSKAYTKRETHELNPLLNRHLKKFSVADSQVLPTIQQWPRLLKKLSQYYDQIEQERYTYERSLSLCSEEIQVLYQRIAQQEEQLSHKQEELVKKTEQLLESKNELDHSQQRTDTIFSALMDLLPGTVLDQKYRLEEKIGSGGFSVVYRATHMGLKRAVAIKIFRPSKGFITPESLQRFRLEGVSSCRINHPNAILVLDSGISEGIPYLVMELLNGHPLSKELKDNSSLSVTRCAQIIVPACAALAEAHLEGIVHRDIKPDNIFLHTVKGEEVVKVVDFGIAKFLDGVPTGGTSSLNNPALTMAGNLIGTPLYMAPERFYGQTYDGKADVYSIGMLLYLMLTGEPPFQFKHNNWMEIAFLHHSKKPRPLREINEQIPEEVENIVLRALSKDASQRPTAQELAEQLLALVAPKTPLSEVVNSGEDPLQVEEDNEETDDEALYLTSVSDNKGHWFGEARPKTEIKIETEGDIGTELLIAQTPDSLSTSLSEDESDNMSLPVVKFQAKRIEAYLDTIVDEQYYIETVLGISEVGVVFRVKHLHTEKLLALKLMNIASTYVKSTVIDRQIQRFKREAEILTKLAHRNIVTITDYGFTSDQVPFIAMEYIDGMTLREWLNIYGQLEPKQAVQIALQVCEAIQAAHQQDVIHCSLTPEDIMLQNQPNNQLLIRVLDFGMAKLKQDLNQEIIVAGELIGSFKYMSPEQIAGDEIDTRTDIFSICVIIYEMLTASIPDPFRFNVKPIQAFREDILPMLNDLVMKGLARSLDERYHTILELKTALEAVAPLLVT